MNKHIFLCILAALFMAGCNSRVETTAKRVVEELTKSSEIFTGRRVAVLDIIILENERMTPLTQTITETINTEMGRRLPYLKCILLERRMIASILAEHDFQLSQLADYRSAQKIGKALGADIIITGTLSEKHGILNARVIEVQSYGILATSHHKLLQTKGENVSDNAREKSTNYFEATIIIIIFQIIVLLLFRNWLDQRK